MYLQAPRALLEVFDSMTGDDESASSAALPSLVHWLLGLFAKTRQTFDEGAPTLSFGFFSLVSDKKG